MSSKNWSDEKIRDEVKQQYAARVASEGSSCCDSSCCQPTETMKGNAVKLAGYSDAELHRLPASAVENSFGCGNPLAFAQVEPGQTVLDIGSGAGIDCFLAAERVGATGRVIGIDMTPEMIARARSNAEAGRYEQVSFRLGQAEAMPVDDASVDWVISNCVINLSPDKPRVFTEIARVLKPGGRFSISDIVLGADLPDEIANSLFAWTGCVAGAIYEKDYLWGLQRAGLTEVSVTSRIQYDQSMINNFINEQDTSLPADRVKALQQKINGQIWSAKISGRKPR